MVILVVGNSKLNGLINMNMNQKIQNGLAVDFKNQQCRSFDRSSQSVFFLLFLASYCPVHSTRLLILLCASRILLSLMLCFFATEPATYFVPDRLPENKLSVSVLFPIRRCLSFFGQTILHSHAFLRWLY